MSMVSITIYSDCLSTVASLPMQTISFWETMSTEASNHSKLCASCSLTKLNIPRTSSCSEEITSAHLSTESMVSTMNANVAITSSCGRLSLIASIASQLLPLLMKKFSVCTVVSALSSALLSRSRELWDPLMCPTLVSSATFCGQIPTRTSKVGEKMTVVFPSPSVKKLFQLLIRSTILTWFAVLIKSLKTGTNFSQRDSLLLSSQHPTIVASLIMPVLWWALTIPWCAVSRFSSLLKRSKRSPTVQVLVEIDLLLLPELNIEMLWS